MGTSSVTDTSHSVTHESPYENRWRSFVRRVVNAKWPNLIVRALPGFYGVWLGYYAYASRDTGWVWMLPLGLSVGMVGVTLIHTVEPVAKHAREIARVSRGGVVLGLSVAGLAAASDMRLAVGLVSAGAGLALLTWTADREVDARAERERKREEMRRLASEESHYYAFKALAESTLYIVAKLSADQVSRPTGKRVAGRRRVRPHEILRSRPVIDLGWPGMGSSTDKKGQHADPSPRGKTGSSHPRRLMG